MTDPHSLSWRLRRQTGWPPSRKPSIPIGPTMVEIARSCPLRACFEASPGYGRRMVFAGRVGTAYHRTLQSLALNPPQAATLAEIGPQALQRFDALLAEQLAEADQRPREQHLPRDPSLVQKARASVVVEAQRIWRSRATTHRVNDNLAPTGPPTSLPANPATWLREVGAVLVEIPVQSPDGLLRGRIDRVERTPRGVRLVDYKAAVRDDLPARYARQLQFYAYLWHAVTSEWPAEAAVIYPFLAAQHSVPINATVCQQVALDAVEVIAQLSLTASMEELATPGDVCRICDFRPWCQPFWRAQRASVLNEETRQRAALGFEAEVTSVYRGPAQIRLDLRWAGVTARLVVPLNRFPHLATMQPGMRVRVLDTRLGGQLGAPTVRLTDFSEIYSLV